MRAVRPYAIKREVLRSWCPDEFGQRWQPVDHVKQAVMTRARVLEERGVDEAARAYATLCTRKQPD